METKDYVVVEISGEYAMLKELSNDNELFIALSLLPFGTDINTKLHWENFEYSIKEN